ncbi:MAG: FKBP-type peptidyl-prolyl cis-trans isomerase N-terminal domain-containing protein [Simkaniaceae bacterium]|nr:FKBP-type peptidyl-prolyl cis-trans isomerase N-terminal domain-containing protein [Simkaniaceae bacterium]
MKTTLCKLAMLPLLTATLLFGNEAATEEAMPPKMELKDINMGKMSEAFGHMVGKNLETLGFEFEVTKIIQGIKDALAGKESPMTEAECIQAMSVLQESAQQKIAQENLDKANTFLAKNAKAKGVVKLESNKLQYRITAKGSGDVVGEHDAPVIKYKGTFIDGKVFGESQETEHISLEETIPGFAKGLVGMKEGEKRTLYIHPELAYKDSSAYFPPNSLLTFEVEIVKANEPMQQDEMAQDDDADLPDESDELVQSEE